MKGKILFAAGLTVGYVLGARAGRARYESIKSSALKVWNDPRVQQQVDAAEAFVKDKAPDVVDFVAGGAKKVVTQVRKKPTATSAASTRGAAATTAASKSSGAQSGTPKSS